MKKWIAAAAAVLLLAGYGWYRMMTNRIQTIRIASSPDGTYTVVVQQIGDPDFPYGNTHCRLLLKQDDTVIDQADADLANDGCSASEDLFTIVWQEDGAQVTVHASEQEPAVYELHAPETANEKESG